MRPAKIPTWMKYLVACGLILKQHDFHCAGFGVFRISIERTDTIGSIVNTESIIGSM